MVGGKPAMSTREKVLRKLKRTYIKMLRRYALGHMAKAHKLEDKAMRLEFELKEKEYAE
jgi:hypothetical protein|tara:strand:- start:312 stop:488 length:177 start_codon:yes stop_codon:yes gene_type:complete